MQHSLGSKYVEEYWKYVASSQAFKYFPIVVARASGSRVWDVDGNEYIDFLSSAATYNIGHSNPEVVDAIKKQLNEFIHYCLYLYHKPVVELAKLLVEITPGSYRKKVAFGLSGGDANDTALKAALIYTKRSSIVSFTYSYHGTTALGIAVGGSFNPKIRELIPFKGVYFAEYPDTYRCEIGSDKPEECGEYYLGKLEDLLRKIPGRDVAAIIFEPIQGDGGVLVPPANFMKGLKKIAEEYNAVLIDDEVQTGMGRTGKLFAIEHFGIEPDLIVLGKALGGGMPISAVVGRAEILDAAPPQTFFATSAAHALSCVAATATVNYILRNRLWERAERLGRIAMKRLEELKEKYEVIGDVRGLGLMIGVDVVKDKASKTPDRKTALKIIWRAFEKGLIMMTYGKYGNVLRIAPPLIISEEDLLRGLDIIEEAVRDVLSGRVPDEVLSYMKAWE